MYSGHSRGNGRWPLNRGWPDNKGSSEISTRGAQVQTSIYSSRSMLYGIMESRKENNKRVFECFYQCSLSI